MKEFVIPALVDHCQVFKENLSLQENGELKRDSLFLWQAFFVNSGYKDIAIDFTKAKPKHGTSLKNLNRFIAETEVKAESGEKKCKPTKCRTFGCTPEQIEQCHKKLLTDKNGKPYNSPTYHIRQENLERYKARAEFNNMKDSVLEKLISGDKSAHMDDVFLNSVVTLKSEDSSAYNKLMDELSGITGVKLEAFNGEVNKRSEALAKEKQVTAIQEQSFNLPDHLKPYAEGTDHSTSYVNENGHIIAIIKDGDGFREVQVSNFVARIKEVREFDDDTEITKQFVIDGLLDGKDKLPEITINAKDFRSMNWVEPYWGNRLITSAPKARDIVRETIVRVSINAPTTKVYYTLGWKCIDDTWHYLYSTGSIGDGKLSVAEISELKGYAFKEYPYNIKECAEFVQKFMDVANHEITIPLLAHAFLSVMIEKLKMEEIEPRYLVWVYGRSGVHKTALTLVLLSFFGTFHSPSATFNDTVAALEKKAYLTKDSLLLVDDFHPAVSQQEDKNKASLANSLTRRYGDRITRSRSKSNLTLAKDFPPRGNLICTSENLLIGHSTNSRHMGIEIHYGDIDSDKLTELQNNQEYLSCFMVGFIRFVAKNIMNDPTVTYKAKFLRYRDKSQNSNQHKRFAEAIACLQIGWRTLLDFLKHIKHIDKAEYKAYLKEGFAIFQDLAKQQNELTQKEDIAYKYMMALKELIDTHQIVPVAKDSPSTLNKGAVICYYDEDSYYFVPQSTYAVVAEFFLKRGDLLNVNEAMLRKMLVDHKYTMQSSDGDSHLTRKIKVGLSEIRVLQIRKAVLNSF